GEGPQLGFDLPFHAPAGLHHEDHHADDENSGGQHHPAFKDVGIEVQARYDDGGADAAQDGGKQSAVNVFAEFVTTDLIEIGEGDSDNECSFDAFSQGNDQGLDHERVPILKMKFIFNKHSTEPRS